MYSHVNRFTSPMAFLWIPLVLQLCHVEANAHWIVTESGRIQAQADSVFNLQRPYDLMAFIRQERRVLELSVIQRQLRLYDEHDGAGLELHGSAQEAGPKVPGESEQSSLISESQKAELPALGDSQETELGPPEEPRPLSSDSQETRHRRFSDLEGLDLSRDSRAADSTPKEHDAATWQEDDCEDAKSLDQFDFYQSTVFLPKRKNISRRDFLEFSSTFESPALNLVPKCTESVSLNFSMHAFEHLPGMQNRNSLKMTSESDFLRKKVLEVGSSVDEFGAMVSTCLKKSPLSWLLYNYAAIYWRMKGDAFEAIECLRRSLHLSPSRYVKSSALLNLANVLHRCHQSTDAIVVLRVALETASEPDDFLLTLGNVHASLGDYKEAQSYYERLLRINEQQQHMEASIRRKAILCHLRTDSIGSVEEEEAVRLETMEKMEKQVEWTKAREKVLSQLVREEEKVAQHQYYDSFKARLTEDDETAGETCRMEYRNGRRVIQCSLPEHHRPLVDSDFAIRSRREEQEVAPLVVNENPISYHIPIRPPLYRKMEQQHFTKNGSDLPYLSDDWPSKAECDLNVLKFPAWNEFQTTYLSPEHKGFEVRALLGVAQGLGPDGHHPFPWYPPICSSDPEIPSGVRSGDHIESVKHRSRLPTAKLPDQSLKTVLLSHVDGVRGSPGSPADSSTRTLDSDEGPGQVTQDEIGQRILTALKQNLGPNWILYNLAALYWRVEGNVFNSIECVRHSLYYVPDQYRDVPLLSLANILYRVGRVDDAFTVMKEALAINSVEPDLYFFMGNLLSAVGNATGAVYHYLEALSQDPSNDGAFRALRIVQCYQRFHQLTRSLAPVRKQDDVTLRESEAQSQSSVAPLGFNVQSYRTACNIPYYWSYERRPSSSCAGIGSWVVREYFDAGLAEDEEDCSHYISNEECRFQEFHSRRP